MRSKIFKERFVWVSSVPLTPVAGAPQSALAAQQTSVYTSDGAILSATTAPNANTVPKNSFIIVGKSATGKTKTSKFIPAKAVVEIKRVAGVASAPFVITRNVSQSASITSYAGYVFYEVQVVSSAPGQFSPFSGTTHTLSFSSATPLSNDALADRIIEEINASPSLSQVATASQAVAGQLTITSDPQTAQNGLYDAYQLKFDLSVTARLKDSVNFGDVASFNVDLPLVAQTGSVGKGTFAQVRRAERNQTGQLPVAVIPYVDEIASDLSTSASVALYDAYTLVLQKVDGYDIEAGGSYTIYVPSTDVNFDDYLLTYFALYGKVTAITTVA